MVHIKEAILIEKNGFYISTDKSLLDIDVIYNFLTNDSYWLKGVTKVLVEASIENSILCYGIYEGNPTSGTAKLVGFARVVSDLVRHSWLGDVFVLPDYRGRGLSKWLMSIIVDHPYLKGTNFHLATKDAHTLYEQYGFQPLESIEKRMARPHDWDAIHAAYNSVNKG